MHTITAIALKSQEAGMGISESLSCLHESARVLLDTTAGQVLWDDLWGFSSLIRCLFECC